MKDKSLTFDKNKIYKVVIHDVNYYLRNYLIFSPKQKITCHLERNTSVKCNFVIDLGDTIEFDDIVGIDDKCSVVVLNEQDMQEIKEVIRKSNGKYAYNRKLNLFTANDTKKFI